MFGNLKKRYSWLFDKFTWFKLAWFICAWFICACFISMAIVVTVATVIISNITDKKEPTLKEAIVTYANYLCQFHNYNQKDPCNAFDAIQKDPLEKIYYNYVHKVVNESFYGVDLPKIYYLEARDICTFSKDTVRKDGSLLFTAIEGDCKHLQQKIPEAFSLATVFTEDADFFNTASQLMLPR